MDFIVGLIEVKGCDGIDVVVVGSDNIRTLFRSRTRFEWGTDEFIRKSCEEASRVHQIH